MGMKKKLFAHHLYNSSQWISDVGFSTCVHEKKTVLELCDLTPNYCREYTSEPKEVSLYKKILL